MMFLRIIVFAACITLCAVLCAEASFICPNCDAEGQNADKDCEANIEYLPCRQETDPVCILAVTTNASPIKVRARYCASREFYNLMKVRCEHKGTCRIAMCDTSGCKVDLPAKA